MAEDIREAEPLITGRLYFAIPVQKCKSMLLTWFDFPVVLRSFAGCCLLFSLPCLPGAAVSSSAPVLSIENLGKGTAPLDGAWQFHLGDNPAWAAPDTGDDAKNVGWEQVTADTTWGAQGHPAYTGFAWYRKHVHLSPAEGASPDFAMLMRHVDDAYEIYWNGVLIGT